MHDPVGNLEVCYHQSDSDYSAYNCYCFKLHQRNAFADNKNTYRQRYNACDETRDVFSDIDGMADVDKEVSYQRQEYT